MSKKATAHEDMPTASAEAPAASGLPLFFKKPAVIDKARHGQAHLGKTADVSFAKATNSVPLNAVEFIESVKSYPIVFTTDEKTPMPVAIVGWEQKNYFIGKNDQWLEGHYVPAYVRQYPFIFFQPPNGDKFYLCIDEGAANFSEKKTDNADPLYGANGEPSELGNRALEFCTAFYQHANITKNLCLDLQKYKLLQPYTSKAKLADGKELQLTGFRMIDEAALNKLPDEVFLEFRKKGWLPFIHLALASASNWKRLMELAKA